MQQTDSKDQFRHFCSNILENFRRSYLSQGGTAAQEGMSQSVGSSFCANWILWRKNHARPRNESWMECVPLLFKPTQLNVLHTLPMSIWYMLEKTNRYNNVVVPRIMNQDVQSPQCTVMLGALHTSEIVQKCLCAKANVSFRNYVYDAYYLIYMT